MPRIEPQPAGTPPADWTTASAQSLQRAVDAGDFEQAHVVLDEISDRLQTSPGSVKKPELRELCLEMPAIIRKAEEADEWSLLEKILGFLALGIPFLVDYLTENEMEKVQRVGKELESKLAIAKNDLEMFDRYGVAEHFKDAIEITGSHALAGKTRFVATVMVRLKKKGLIDETSKLKTPLPDVVMTRVS